MGERPRNRLRVWYQPMVAREPHESHRVATSLELLFDLCFVVAVGRAGSALHHALAENHVGHGVFSYLCVFFAIWWAWLQFSWFASAYDTDDVSYRLAVLVQIAGSLVIAAGVRRAFEGDFAVVAAGYVVMRLAGVTQWLRAARGDPGRRRTAVRYVLGITLLQIAWLARLALPASWLVPSFLFLAVAELAVPVWAEQAGHTTWHAHHIAERYGCFTLIVLGETVVGATNAIEEGLHEGHHIATLVSVAAAGLIIVFSMWWLYFDQPGHKRLTSFHRAVVVSYGHYFIFAAAAAVGAGMEVAVDYDTHKGHLAHLPAGLAIPLPVAIYLISTWLLHIGPSNECRPIAIGFPVAALLVLAAAFSPAPVHVTAAIAAGLVAVVVLSTRGHPIHE